jgi:pyruvate-formate lyase-activating enzyme
VGRGGSGTIFFGHCNMACLFCQNHDISCDGEGEEVTAAQLAEIMLSFRLAAATTSTSSHPAMSSHRFWRHWTWRQRKACVSRWFTTQADMMRCAPCAG